MNNKSKLIYVTPDQQQWLANTLTNILDSQRHSPDEKIVASAILKKLHGRKEKTNDQARFTV